MRGTVPLPGGPRVVRVTLPVQEGGRSMISPGVIGACIAGFLVLDGIWLGLVMRDFYRTQLSAIGRFVDGSFAPVWSAALLVYVLLGVGVGVFVVPRASST